MSSFVHTKVCSELQKEGQEVTVLTRSEEKASDLEKLGTKVVVGDLLQPESFMPALSPQDAVISVAMPDIRPGRISLKRFKILSNQTTSYFSTAIAIAEKSSSSLILTLGTIFRTIGEKVLDESWPIERPGMTKIGELVDPLISEVIRRGSPPLIQMLPGEIYGLGGLFRKFMCESMKKGRYRVIGSGKNYIPRIHVEDCVEAYIQGLEKMPLGERFIIADDGAFSQSEFSDFMADCLSVQRPTSIPDFMVRIFMGRFIYETVTMNCRVTNAKAKRDLDWKLKYPTYREVLPVGIGEIENMAVHD